MCTDFMYSHILGMTHCPQVFLCPAQQKHPANLIHQINHAQQKMIFCYWAPSKKLSAQGMYISTVMVVQQSASRQANFWFAFTHSKLKIKSCMIKKQSLQGAGCWALGTCYTDKKEYCHVQPSLHVLGTFVVQGVIFVWIIRGLSGYTRQAPAAAGTLHFVQRAPCRLVLIQGWPIFVKNWQFVCLSTGFLFKFHVGPGTFSTCWLLNHVWTEFNVQKFNPPMH